MPMSGSKSIGHRSAMVRRENLRQALSVLSRRMKQRFGDRF